MNAKISSATLAAAVLMACSLSAQAAEVSFDHGREGWRGVQGSGGATFIDRRLGNDAPALHTVFNDFGIKFSTRRNADFLGDYTQNTSVQIGLDVNTLGLSFSGQDVSRQFIVELRDYDNPPDGYSYTSVWATLGTLTAATPGWQSWSVTIADTSATALPAGWGGYGAEDPVTYEPTLPPGRTFANVLASVDELAFTTLVPGYFFGFTDHDVAIDNIFVRAVPEPGSALLLIGGLAALGWRRRTVSTRA